MYKWQRGSASNILLFVLPDDMGREIEGLGDAFNVELSINGAPFVAGAGARSEQAGWYIYEATQAESATLGMVAIKIWGAGTAQQNLVATIEDDVLATQVPGSYASGTAGHALGRLSSIAITVTAPQGTSNSLTLMYGDDYMAVDGRALTFSSESWPVLTGGLVALKINTDDLDELDGVVLSASSIRFEFTGEEIESFGVGRFKYEVEAILANGHIVTLMTGVLTIMEDIR